MNAAPPPPAPNGNDDDRHRPLTGADGRRLLGLATLLLLVWVTVNATRTTLLLFAVVFLAAMVLNPLVVWLGRRARLGRGLAVGALALVVLALAGLAGWLVVPALLDQVQELIQKAPAVGATLRGRAEALAQRYPALGEALPSVEDVVGALPERVGGVARFLVRSTVGVVGGVVGLFLGVLLLAFVLADPGPLVRAYLQLWPDRHREAARRTLARLMTQMTAWIKGVCINGAITGTSTGLLLWLVGVQPALVFGALAFLGEFVPNVGPIVVAVPALLVAASQGAGTFGLALAAILFVQQVETNLLVPVVLGKTLDLHPVEIFFWTLTAGTLYGLAGAVLAVPIAALVRIAVDEFYLRPRRLDHVAIATEADRLAAGETEVGR